MIVVAIVGSHGTGKTSTITELRQLRPEWVFVSESTRLIMPSVGFDDPYAFIDDFGIAKYELLILGQWCVIDPSANPFITNSAAEVMILDRSPLDNLAYYYLFRRENEIDVESILRQLAERYLSQIDEFILFPIGQFEFEPDNMQRKELQLEHELEVRRLAGNFGIVLRVIESLDPQSRAAELVTIVGEHSVQ